MILNDFYKLTLESSLLIKGDSNVIWQLNPFPSENRLNIEENVTLVIDCKGGILLKNGGLFRLDEGRYKDQVDDNYVIKTSSLIDSGKYECLHYENGREKIVAKGSLTVTGLYH